MTAKEITKKLIKFIDPRRSQNNFYLTNCFVLGSPWESDLIKVKKTFYWTEYEVKRTRSDFFSDFKKLSHYYGKGGVAKHSFYKGNVKEKWRNKLIPKPKQFYFVTPKGLVKLSEVPKHCGLIEIGNWGTIRRTAPILKNHSKIDSKKFWNLAVKAGNKCINI